MQLDCTVWKKSGPGYRRIQLPPLHSECTLITCLVPARWTQLAITLRSVPMNAHLKPLSEIAVQHKQSRFAGPEHVRHEPDACLGSV
jgi:hypothetical protein